LGAGFIEKCNSCGKEFEIREGGDFTFHLLHCDKCGAEKSIINANLNHLERHETSFANYRG